MPSTFVPDFEVRIQGLLLQADVRDQVTQVTYDNQLDAADMFTIEMTDPGSRLIDSPLFAPGKTVELRMGYAGDLEPVMLGEVTALEPSFSGDSAPRLVVRGYDKSLRMRHNAAERSFLGLNDSLVAAQVAAENLLIPIVDPAPRPPQKVVNQRGSDFAFLTRLARRNGFEVLVRFDKLYFRFPRPQLEAVALEWGKDLISFSPRLSTAGQAGLVEVQGYSEELARAIVAILPATAAGLDDLLDRLGEDAASLLLSLGRRKVEAPDVSNPVGAATLAMAELMALLEGLAEASGTCPGTTKLRAGEQVKISGVGRRFSGTYRLRRATHTISDRGYETRFEASQRASSTLLDSLREKVGKAPLPDAPTAPPGIAVGVVESNVDPAGLGQILVRISTVSKDLRCWARVARLDAGSGSGTFFMPDIDDEVVVAFIHGGIESAVILGSLWSATRRPPEALVNPLNPKRVIQTRSGHRIEFDDTPGLERLVVQHARVGKVSLEATPTGSLVTVEDGLKNSVRMTGVAKPPGASEVAVESSGTITLKAAGVITITGEEVAIVTTSKGASVTATGQKVEIKGGSVDLTVSDAVNVVQG